MYLSAFLPLPLRGKTFGGTGVPKRISWRKRMSQSERRQNARHQYRVRRDLPVWHLIGLENQGVLNWRFRPRYIDVRVKRAVRGLWKDNMEAAA